MGLLPLEFTDCLTDSPYFRENLHAHENELSQTSQQIKGLIKQVKELVDAARILSKAQRNLASTLTNFSFECIGTERTDDEIIIAGSLKEFGRLLNTVEDERDRMLDRMSESFIQPIECFRINQIGAAKDQKKKFDRETAKFCTSLERHLNLSTKKSENSLQEADANLGMEQRHFVQASLEYILKLQEVQERKKFEFVETGHEVAKDFKSFMTDLQIRLQRTRDNYHATQHEAQNLMLKMLEARKTKPQDPGTLNKMYTRQGYLFLLEKKAFGTSHWIKHFCQYQKETRRFTMISYNQTVSKINTTETITLKECIRRMSDSIDKRFCFDVIPVEKPNSCYTFQALSEEDRKLWLDAMDGQEPHLTTLPSIGGGSPSDPTASGIPSSKGSEECALDDLGFAFVNHCIEWIESRGLEDQGLYRVTGVNSRINRLLQNALDRRKHPVAGDNGENKAVYTFDTSSDDWELRTVTSALKTFFRNLPEPLMSYRLHQAFIAAAKQESRAKRIDIIHCLVHDLPKTNFEMLHILMKHLNKVADKSDKNLMTISNLSVCFGPTLLRSEDESMSGILDIKFANVVVEILIENCDKIFKTKPVEGLSSQSCPLRGTFSPIASVSPQQHQQENQAVYARISQVTQSSPHDQQLQHQRTSPSYATLPSRGASLSSFSVANNNSMTNMSRANSHDHLTMTQLHQQQQQGMSGTGTGGRRDIQLSQFGHPLPQHPYQQHNQPLRVGSQQQLHPIQQQQQHIPQHHLSSTSLVSSPLPSNFIPGPSQLNSVPASGSSFVDQQQILLHHQQHSLQTPSLVSPVNGYHNQGNNRSLARPLAVYQPNHWPSVVNQSHSPPNNNHSGSHVVMNALPHISSNSNHNIIVHPIVQAAPDIPSESGTSGSSPDSSSIPIHQQQSQHQLSHQHQSSLGRSSSPSNPSYSGYSTPATAGNNGSRQGFSSASQSQYSYPSSGSAHSMTSSHLHHSTPSSSLNVHPSQSVPSSHPVPSLSSTTGGKRVRALYNCVGENPAELSFEPNAIIYDVRPSKEPGWLEGTYMGKTGLIPANYVQAID